MKIFILLLGLVHLSYAQTPVWSFTQDPNFPAKISIYKNETKTIKYTVHNNSSKSKTLTMKPIVGISASGCETLAGGGNCTLTLTVRGAEVSSTTGGPILCQSGVCYRPSQQNELNIQLITDLLYVITASAGVNGIIAPTGESKVAAGNTLEFTATPNSGYQVRQWMLDGTPVSTGGTSYQLSNITTNHNISVEFTPIQYTVTAVAGENGSISPPNSTNVNSGNFLSFTAIPNTGYQVSQWMLDGASVQTGGDSYQLRNITTNHNISVEFTPIQYTVTAVAGENGSISPPNSTSVNSGNSLSFTAIPNTGYQVSQWMLDGASVQTGGDSYQLRNITTNHNISVEFTPIQYTVTAVSSENGSINPTGPLTIKYGNSIEYTAFPIDGYGIYQWKLDGALVPNDKNTYNLSNIIASHDVTVSFSEVKLTSSLNSLALSVNCRPASTCTLTQNKALTGTTRTILIKNIGDGAASNLRVENTGLPDGTIMTNHCESTLGGKKSCTIDVTPGDKASSSCTESHASPDAGTITVRADGIPDLKVSVYVLGYGCQYQGGFLYSVDDTTPVTGSIGGKVVSLVDQAGPYIGKAPQASSIIWSSNGSGGAAANVSYDIIYGISETSTTISPNPSTNQQTGQTACLGNNNGACNTNNIYVYYENVATNHPINLKYYAAGLCKGTIKGYSDWYLPAICEMDAVNTYVSCSSGTQSMLASLSFLIGDPSVATPSTSCTPPSGTNCLAGLYWSSTELSLDPHDDARLEFFRHTGSIQAFGGKFNQLGVRCSRNLSY